MSKIKLSVAIATYNEEKNIIDCLDSLNNFADEIIVVDGNSTDNTSELAKAHGAKVISVENNPMFHKNKNLAISKCKGEWIFVIDADERVSKDLKAEILNTIKDSKVEKGYWVNRKNWFLGGFLKKGGAYPDPVIRLFKNGSGSHPEETVHEQIKINGSVGRLNNDILHYADPTFERYLLRANRYTDETAKKMAAKKIKKNFINTIYYLLIKPILVFLNIYFRHAGFKDGFRGFIWALFSGAHYYYAFIKFKSNRY